MSFTRDLYTDTQEIQSLIINHEFPMGIADGSLDFECFKHFIEQDYYFLIEYSKILGLATIKSPDYETMSKFSILLEETLNNEMQLHISFSKKLGIEESTLKKIIPTIQESYFQIAVEGHTDSDQLPQALRVKYPSNWELSGGRAAAVVRLMITLGVNPTRLEAVGYGEFVPRDRKNTEVINACLLYTSPSPRDS